MFVLKLFDKEYNSWSYFVNGCFTGIGKTGFFYEDDIFHTEEEAKKYIQTLLNSGWFRKDIVETDFSVVEVKQHNGYGSAWYTDEYFNKLTT